MTTSVQVLTWGHPASVAIVRVDDAGEGHVVETRVVPAHSHETFVVFKGQDIQVREVDDE